MTADVTVVSGLRALLVVLVAFGVAGMHTLGHPGSGHGGPHATSAGDHAAAHPMATHAVPELHMAEPDAAAVIGYGTGLDPSQMCLAVLTATDLTVLTGGALDALCHTCTALAARTAGPAATGRDPPRHTRYGLRIADLSVVRT